ncbi:MAG: hypothetical protein WC455_22735 [Dehalococcoidia bacterium]|jgi:hypothetical protein
MAPSVKWFGNALLLLADKKIDWASDAIKVALTTVDFTPLQDTHDYFDHITNEVSAVDTGYTAGGAAIGTPTIAYDADTNVVKLDGDDVQWTEATFTARWGIIYDSTPGSAATNPLIAYVDFDGDQSPSNGTFKITWNTDGILTATVS